MKVLIVGEGASELAGALQALVVRLAPSELDIHHDKVSNKHIHVHHGKGDGCFKRAIRWMLEAEKRGFDALVLIIDQDGQVDRTKQFAEAQEYSHASIRRALGVAIRTFDSWMLADEAALSKVTGFTINRLPDAETLRAPKATFEALYDRMHTELSHAHVYAEIARVSDLATLESRCPKGFAPFAARVRAL